MRIVINIYVIVPQTKENMHNYYNNYLIDAKAKGIYLISFSLIITIDCTQI